MEEVAMFQVHERRQENRKYSKAKTRRVPDTQKEDLEASASIFPRGAFADAELFVAFNLFVVTDVDVAG
jgi:hypothetical protein